MKKYNKFLAGVMAVCLMGSISIIPESIAPAVSLTASAEEEYIYENLTYQIKYQQTGETGVEITKCDESATDVFIPDYIDNYKVTNINSSAFKQCLNLRNVTIGENVRDIDLGAFTDVYSLESINVSRNNQNFSTDMGVLFDKNKTHIIRFPSKSYQIRYTIPDTVTSIDYRAFHCCFNLTSVTIPDSVTIIGKWAFNDCRNITSLKIPDSVKTISSSAFYDCKSIKSITIPASVDTIGDDAFRNCLSLESIKILDGVSTIGKCAFGFDTKLTSVEIPASVTEIKQDAFVKCTELSEVTILNPDCKIEDSSGTFSHVYDFDDKRYYFDGTIRGYENSTAQAYAEKNGYKFESLGKAPEENTATGDFDGDGEFNVADVVAFQQYILGVSDMEISDWKQADLYPDGILDVFDLCLMRKKLIGK